MADVDTLFIGLRSVLVLRFSGDLHAEDSFTAADDRQYAEEPMDKRPRQATSPSPPQIHMCSSGVDWDAPESSSFVVTASSSRPLVMDQELEFRDVVENLTTQDGFGRAAAEGMCMAAHEKMEVMSREYRRGKVSSKSIPLQEHIGQEQRGEVSRPRTMWFDRIEGD